MITLGDLYVRSAPLRQDLYTLIGRQWTAYSLVASLGVGNRFPAFRRQNLVCRDTAVCDEASAGSGNSFFVTGFSFVNPDVRVAHHHHVGAQITRAAALGVPTVALLRHPVDCVVSRTIGNPAAIGAAYRQWIRFFRSVMPVRGAVLVASFDVATRRPGVLVGEVNRRFGTLFRSDVPDAETIFRIMDEKYSRVVGTAGLTPNRAARGRAPLKRTLRRRVVNHRLAPVAIRLYEAVRPDVQ